MKICIRLSTTLLMIAIALAAGGSVLAYPEPQGMQAPLRAGAQAAEGLASAGIDILILLSVGLIMAGAILGRRLLGRRVTTGQS